MPKDSLTVIDNRTGKQYELPIQDGTIHATDLRQIQLAPDDHGLLSYDPAFMNTASARSAITFIDGDRGILRYRGYPIEQLAERSTSPICSASRRGGGSMPSSQGCGATKTRTRIALHRMF